MSEESFREHVYQTTFHSIKVAVETLEAIFVMLSYVLLFFQFAIIGRAILSWFDRGMQNPISQMLYQITEPIIAPIRQFMPRTGMIDLSPLIALIIIIVLQRMLATAASG